MNEYHVVIYGLRGTRKERVSAVVTTKAASPRMAILQVSGIEEAAIHWDHLGHLDDVTVYGYEVMQ